MNSKECDNILCRQPREVYIKYEDCSFNVSMEREHYYCANHYQTRMDTIMRFGTFRIIEHKVL